MKDMNTNIPKELQTYIPIVHFLGESLGSNYEVFLYSLVEKEHRILAIANGFISGRKEGSLMRDVIIKILESEKVSNRDWLIQKNAVAKDGRHFKSSTMVIRNAKGKAVGALGVNFLVDDFLLVHRLLKSFNVDMAAVENIHAEDVMFSGEVFEENEGKSADFDLILKKVMYNHPEANVDTVAGRQKLIDALYGEGIFAVRGAVSYVAERLNMSEPSVYRYMNKSKKEKEK